VLSTIYNYLVGTGFADDVNRGMQLGGNVYGNHSHHPTMVHYKDRWANDQ
jgi:hypothetical protein